MKTLAEFEYTARSVANLKEAQQELYTAQCLSGLQLYYSGFATRGAVADEGAAVRTALIQFWQHKVNVHSIAVQQAGVDPASVVASVPVPEHLKSQEPVK